MAGKMQVTIFFVSLFAFNVAADRTLTGNQTITGVSTNPVVDCLYLFNSPSFTFNLNFVNYSRLDCGGRFLTIIDSTDILIEESYFWAVNNDIRIVNSSNITIRRNTFANYENGALHAVNIIDCTNVTIEDNIFWGNADEYLPVRSLIRLQNVRNAQINNNYFYVSTYASIAVDISDANNWGTYVTQNFFVNWGQLAIAVGGKNNRIQRNTFWSDVDSSSYAISFFNCSCDYVVGSNVFNLPIDEIVQDDTCGCSSKWSDQRVYNVSAAFVPPNGVGCLPEYVPPSPLPSTLCQSDRMTLSLILASSGYANQFSRFKILHTTKSNPIVQSTANITLAYQSQRYLFDLPLDVDQIWLSNEFDFFISEIMPEITIDVNIIAYEIILGPYNMTLNNNTIPGATSVSNADYPYLQIAMYGNISLYNSSRTLIPLCSIPPITSSDAGSSAGMIAGIVVGVIALAIIGGIIAFLMYRRKKGRKDPDANREMPIYESRASIPNQTDETAYQTLPMVDLSRSSIIADEEYNINYADLKITKELGQGAYGSVHLAEWRGSQVAVKNLKKELCTNVDAFMMELKIHRNLRPHVNVVLCLGITQSPLSIVTEYVERGSLLSIFKSDKTFNLNSTFNLKKIVEGIVAGMLHLHSEGIIHRDLAARNVLLTESWQPKLSDLGMSRISQEDTQMTASDVGPLRWMAPESVSNREYSVKSDVWMFGCLLIEIYTNGQPPHPTLDPLGAATGVAFKGLIPNIPDAAPPVMQNIMKNCFQFKPNDRPNFQDILTVLRQNG